MKALAFFIMLIATPALAQPDYETNEHICAGATKFVMSHTGGWQQAKNPVYFYDDNKSTCAAYLLDYDLGKDVSSILTDIERTSWADSRTRMLVRKITEKALKMKMVLQQ